MLADASLLVSVTTAPSAGAGLLSVTIPCAVLPPVTLDGATLKLTILTERPVAARTPYLQADASFRYQTGDGPFRPRILRRDGPESSKVCVNCPLVPDRVSVRFFTQYEPESLKVAP